MNSTNNDIFYGIYHFDSYSNKWKPCHRNWYSKSNSRLVYVRRFADCDFYKNRKYAEMAITDWVESSEMSEKEFKIVAKRAITDSYGSVKFVNI